jgi:hypothetical protein
MIFVRPMAGVETVKKTIAVLVVVLLFACNRQASPPLARGDASAPAPTVETARIAQSSSAPGRTAAAPKPPAAPRMIVRTADVRIIVGDTSKAVAAVTKSIEGAGGYVSGSSIWREGELLRAKLTLRVPADKLTAALASIRGAAKRVENETVTSEDVTQEYVDLGSQLRNLEATEVELRELLTSVREKTKRAADVLEVHEQLTTIRGQIEQTKGRMGYLTQTSSMSTIALDITPDALAAPVIQPGWQPLVVVKNASRALVGALQGLADIAIWIIIYVVPIGGIVVLFLWLLWKAIRRSRAKVTTA